MENKKYPTDKQLKYMLDLVSVIDMYIELIEKPEQKPKDFILRDILIKEDFCKEVMTNKDVQNLIKTLTRIGIITELLYRSSRDRDGKSSERILTVEKFIKKESDGFGFLKTFKNDYVLLYRYFDLIKYDSLEKIILANLRDN